jgi:hypothetical protein
MSEKRYLVPEGMWHAAEHAAECGFTQRQILEAALRWWSENPIMPKDDQLDEMICDNPIIMKFISDEAEDSELDAAVDKYRVLFSVMLHSLMSEWQRRMFLAPNPEVPEAVKDLLLPCDTVIQQPAKDRNADILEAYRRGKKSK